MGSSPEIATMPVRLPAIERLMGLLLVTIAVQMMMDGVLQFWNAHRP